MMIQVNLNLFLVIFEDEFDPHRKEQAIWDRSLPFSLKLNASGEIDLDYNESYLVHPSTTQKAKKIHKV